MSNKVKERRERKIKEAIKAKNWDEVTRLLQQEKSNDTTKNEVWKKAYLVMMVNDVNAMK